MSGGYEQALSESVQAVEAECTSCGNMGRLTTIRIKDVEPEEVVCVFKCDDCGDKSVSFFNKVHDRRGSVRIECSFDSLRDLHREVNLNEQAAVEIDADGFSYRYESNIPGVYTVECLLRKAEDEIKSLCGRDDITSRGRGKILGEIDASLEMCEKQLDIVQVLIREPRFRMVIEDEFGLSRVAPVGKGVFELQNADIREFDDDKVMHVFRERTGK